MANYIVSYDLNGSTPTHHQMDQHLEKAGYTRGRILETVWYVKTTEDLATLFRYVNQILSVNDRLIVVHALNAHLRNLLVENNALIKEWNG